jgi:hypothetical protein
LLFVNKSWRGTRFSPQAPDKSDYAAADDNGNHVPLPLNHSSESHNRDCDKASIPESAAKRAEIARLKISIRDLRRVEKICWVIWPAAFCKKSGYARVPPFYRFTNFQATEPSQGDRMLGCLRC